MTASNVISVAEWQNARRDTEPIDSRRPEGSGVGPVPAAGLYRLTHSPMLADLRRHGYTAGLILAVLIVLVWSWL